MRIRDGERGGSDCLVDRISPTTPINATISCAICDIVRRRLYTIRIGFFEVDASGVDPWRLCLATIRGELGQTMVSTPWPLCGVGHGRRLSWPHSWYMGVKQVAHGHLMDNKRFLSSWLRIERHNDWMNLSSNNWSHFRLRTKYFNLRADADIRHARTWNSNNSKLNLPPLRQTNIDMSSTEVADSKDKNARGIPRAPFIVRRTNWLPTLKLTSNTSQV